MLYDGVFRHYQDTLGQIHEHGYYATLADAATPYLRGAADQWRPARESFTERLLSGRIFKGLWSRKDRAD